MITYEQSSKYYGFDYCSMNNILFILILFRDTFFTMAECGLVTEAKEALVLYGNGDILECTAKLKNIQKEILHVDR